MYPHLSWHKDGLIYGFLALVYDCAINMVGLMEVRDG